jgi:hypothetical protein
MKCLIFTFIILFLAYNHLFSQDLNGKRITLEANTSVSGSQFTMETSCYEKEIKIKVIVKDSVSENAFRADSAYKFLVSSIDIVKFDLKNDTLMNLIRKIDSVRKVHTAYIVDSLYITYNEFPNYKKLLNDLFNSSQTKLENINPNKQRIILDGTPMKFKFSQNGSSIFTTYAHSPSDSSHPLLFNYIKETLSILRKEKQNTLITKEITSGY